jgi:hypothetical protein
MLNAECILIQAFHKDMVLEVVVHLVAAIYDKYAHNKITVLENLTREKLLQLKTIFLKWNLFSTEKVLV